MAKTMVYIPSEKEREAIYGRIAATLKSKVREVDFEEMARLVTNEVLVNLIIYHGVEPIAEVVSEQ